MTNQERLISLLGFTPPANSCEAELLDAGISPTGVYTVDNSVPLKTIAVQLMKMLLTTADTSNSTVGFHIIYDRKAVLERIKLLEIELGIFNDSVPTIKGKQPW